ncbi:hypothetical protein LNP17_17005 [Klebsiella variicola subsp. variicola]|nr:hypothetical protein [Klebsiella variicola subsp. variicola]
MPVYNLRDRRCDPGDCRSDSGPVDAAVEAADQSVRCTGSQTTPKTRSGMLAAKLADAIAAQAETLAQLGR